MTSHNIENRKEILESKNKEKGKSIGKPKINKTLSN